MGPNVERIVRLDGEACEVDAEHVRERLPRAAVQSIVVAGDAEIVVGGTPVRGRAVGCDVGERQRARWLVGWRAVCCSGDALAITGRVQRIGCLPAVAEQGGLEATGLVVLVNHRAGSRRRPRGGRFEGHRLHDPVARRRQRHSGRKTSCPRYDAVLQNVAIRVCDDSRGIVRSCCCSSRSGVVRGDQQIAGIRRRRQSAVSRRAAARRAYHHVDGVCRIDTGVFTDAHVGERHGPIECDGYRVSRSGRCGNVLRVVDRLRSVSRTHRRPNRPRVRIASSIRNRGDSGSGIPPSHYDHVQIARRLCAAEGHRHCRLWRTGNGCVALLVRDACRTAAGRRGGARSIGITAQIGNGVSRANTIAVARGSAEPRVAERSSRRRRSLSER